MPAHRDEYVRLFGALEGEDRAQLEAFARVRRAHAEAPRGMSAMREHFLTAPSLDAALVGLARELSPTDLEALRRSLAWFRPKYRRVWHDGRVPRAFLAAARRDPTDARLDRLLTGFAAFLGVDPASKPRPLLALVPVPDGWGTHAYALGDTLLLEIRPGDELADQAAVIVHENVHFLWTRIPEDRMARLEETARSAGPRGAAAWAALHEALPTALGQGVTDRAFRPSVWSPGAPWYHTAEVDRYAKALLSIVDESLAAGRVLDASFVRAAVAAYPDGPPRSDEDPSTAARSPRASGLPASDGR